MDSQELLALYDKEQRIEIEYPEVRKEIFPNLVRIVRPAPGMNQVVYSRLDEDELDAVIREQITYFRQFDQPFSWQVYDHDKPPGLKEHLVKHGFVTDDDPDAMMVLDTEDVPPQLLAPVRLDIRRLTERIHLDDVTRIEAEVWGGDFAWLKERLGAHLEVPDYLSVYVAYVEGQPACSGWIYFHPNSHFAGLFGGATVPEHRSRGLYRAVLAVRVQEAIRRGYRFLTTGASPMSRPILELNGFRFLTYAYAYEWKERVNNL
ncbi:MAG: GNAT family N-acetyltransferase [Anaerolineae bacterium]|nr:GNAT family N-acetyltransferase [Anaerolineae bacterium]